MVPMGQKLFGSLNPVHTGGPMQVSIAFAEKHTDGYPWKIDGTVRRRSSPCAADCGSARITC